MKITIELKTSGNNLDDRAELERALMLLEAIYGIPGDNEVELAVAPKVPVKPPMFDPRVFGGSVTFNRSLDDDRILLKKDVDPATFRTNHGN